MIEVTQTQNVAVVGLNRDVTNALNLELLQSLSRTLARLESDPRTIALILTSGNQKFFSIGFDIPALYELPRDEFAIFYETFNRTCLELYTFPKPTIAAIPGHAIAGGCILALCCDRRLIQMGRKLMGLNEIKLGVPVPYLAQCILTDLVGTGTSRDMVERGEFYEVEESLHMGLVDRVCSETDLLPVSVAEARAMGDLDGNAFRIIKENRVDVIAGRVQNRLAEKQRRFLDLWYSPRARELLLEAKEKFKPSKER